MYTVREGTLKDRDAVGEMYRRVAEIRGGIAREADEISHDWLDHWMHRSLKSGVWLVAESAPDGTVQKNTRPELLGSVHAYELEPRVFSHVLGQLTIAVEPLAQAKGVGRLLFTSFLQKVRSERPNIQRVELMARESNVRAIAFYQKIGFKIEGRLERRIKSVGDGYEADISMAWFR